jgi:hypothetical protein
MTLTQKLKSGLKKLDDLEIRLLGNRITVFGELLMINGVASITRPDDYLGPIIGSLGALAGVVLTLATDFGRITYDKYKEVECHIQYEGKPDKRFLKTVMRIREKLPLGSYCDAQGAWLACAKSKHEKEFLEVEKESANWIPNL